jgi:hypothetical protein
MRDCSQDGSDGAAMGVNSTMTNARTTLAFLLERVPVPRVVGGGAWGVGSPGH